MASTKKAKAEDKKPAAKKVGRPHGYTEEKALEICAFFEVSSIVSR